jgi:hypothetical protein
MKRDRILLKTILIFSIINSINGIFKISRDIYGIYKFNLNMWLKIQKLKIMNKAEITIIF